MTPTRAQPNPMRVPGRCHGPMPRRTSHAVSGAAPMRMPSMRRQGRRRHHHPGQQQPRTTAVVAHGANRRVDRGRAGDAEEGERLDEGDVEEHRSRQQRQHAAHHRDRATPPQIPGDEHGQRHQRGAQHDGRELGGERGRPEDGHGDGAEDRGQRHPVAVARDRQLRIGRKLRADVEEAPEDRHAEAVAGDEPARDDLVVGRIEVRGVAHDDRGGDPGGQRHDSECGEQPPGGRVRDRGRHVRQSSQRSPRRRQSGSTVRVTMARC